jgi:hypothetical protein
MSDSIIIQYKKMKKRHQKLDRERMELENQQKRNLRYFIENQISDKEWQTCIEKTACDLASASVTIKIADEKMKQIKDKLFNKENQK